MGAVVVVVVVVVVGGGGADVDVVGVVAVPAKFFLFFEEDVLSNSR